MRTMPIRRGHGSGRSSAPKLHLVLSAEVGKSHVPFLRRHIRSAHALLSPPLSELSIALVGEHRMSELHQEFMDIPSPTDVLTFPLESDEERGPTAGEIVICVPYARRISREHGTPLQHELLLYAVHGLLHLSGFDDKTARGFQLMHRTEDQILTRLGIGPVFHPSPLAATRRKAP